MKTFLFLFLFAFSQFSIARESNPEQKQILTIQVGETQIIEASPDAKVIVRGKNLVSIQENESSITILAVSPGIATIHIDERPYEIRVEKAKSDIARTSRFNILNGKMGLFAQKTIAGIRYTGECLRFDDYSDILQFHDKQNSRFQFQAKFDPDIESEIIKYIHNEFEKSSFNAPIVNTNPYVNLIFPIKLKDSEKSIAEISNRLGFSYRFEKSPILVEKLIRVQIIIAEVNKRIQEDFGIAWPDSFQARILPKLTGPQSLDIFIKSLVTRGFGRILASPTLVAKSGAEAEFHAGGEIPFKIVTRSVHEIHWKRHGLFLKIKPTADSSGRMSIDLTSEISLIDGSTNVEGLPGMKTNRVTSAFDLESPRTIILSGLTRQDSTSGTSGLNTLSDIPVLGALFRSQNYINMKTELAVFVSPEIVKDDETSTPPNWTDREFAR